MDKRMKMLEKNKYTTVCLLIIVKRLSRYGFILLSFLLLSWNLNGQSLSDYLEIAKTNNTMLKVKRMDVELAEEKINEVGNLPNTGFAFGIYASRPETRVGSQVMKFGVSQEFPWFSSNKVEKEWYDEKAKLKTYDVKLAQRDLFFQIKKLYYEMYQNQQKIEILKDNKLILKVYENMALAALENNRASLSDVLKIQAQENLLHSQIFKAKNDLDLMRKKFNRLLEREVDGSVNIPDSLNASEIMQNSPATDAHPSLQKLDALKMVFEKEEQKINKQSKPKFKVGLDYIPVNQRTDLNPTDNGKDVLMPSIGLSIPIFNKKYASQLKQVDLKNKQLEYLKEDRQKQIEIALDEALAELENAMISLMASQKNIEVTQRTIDVDMKAYETGQFEYNRILNLQLQKIKLQLAEIEATKMAFIAKAKLEYLSNEEK